MEPITIAEAVRAIEDILPVLDDAYWAAPDIAAKDNFHDLVCLAQNELNELAKLSVEDHYMLYEPVTELFKNSQAKFRLLSTCPPHWVSRTELIFQLENETPRLLKLFKSVG